MKKQSLIGFVRNIPISKRIVLLVLLVSIVPILIANIFGYYKAYNAVQNTAVNYNLRLLDSLNQNIVSIANSGSIYLDELITESAVRNTVIHFDELDASDALDCISDHSFSFESDELDFGYGEESEDEEDLEL